MLNTYRYKGGEVVKAGFYWNLAEWEAKIVPAEGGPLAGTAETRYLRVPILVVLVLAPIMGLTYAMFLPFIGFAMVAYLLGGKVVEAASGVAAQAGRVRRPAWAPTLAFLSRSKPADTAKPYDTAPDAWTEDVEKKLNETDSTER